MPRSSLKQPKIPALSAKATLVESHDISCSGSFEPKGRKPGTIKMVSHDSNKWLEVTEMPMRSAGAISPTRDPMRT
jgi:hypothetical protein